MYRINGSRGHSRRVLTIDKTMESFQPCCPLDPNTFCRRCRWLFHPTFSLSYWGRGYGFSSAIFRGTRHRRRTQRPRPDRRLRRGGQGLTTSSLRDRQFLQVAGFGCDLNARDLAEKLPRGVRRGVQRVKDQVSKVARSKFQPVVAL